MDIDQIRREIDIKAVRSSGAGGQHVNKVSTKIEVQFDVIGSEGLSEIEKSRILNKLKSKLNKAGIVIITSQTSRSQIQNKKDAESKLIKMLEVALLVKKKRKPTKPTKAGKEKRLKAKKLTGEKKASRSKPKDIH